MTSVVAVDVAIVGGGLAGMTLALALSELPLKVTLIEARPKAMTKEEGSRDRRSLALSYGSVNLLQQLDLWSTLLPFATAIEKIHVSDRGHFGSVRLSAAEERVPALGYVIELATLLTELENAMTHTTVETLHSAVVRELHHHSDYAEVVVNTPSQTLSLQAKWVICADGVDSQLRHQLGIAIEEQDYQQVAIAANVGLKRDHAGVAYERFTEQGPLALLPLANRAAALVWTIAPHQVSELLTCTDSVFLQKLQTTFGYRLGRFEWVGQRQAFPLKLLKAERLYQQRVLLLGAAAHHLHPIAGQGFNLTLRDIADLVALFKESVDQIGEHYQQLRERDQDRTLLITDSLVKGYSSSLFPITPLRNLALIFLERAPLLKTQLNRVMMGVS